MTLTPDFNGFKLSIHALSNAAGIESAIVSNFGFVLLRKSLVTSNRPNHASYCSKWTKNLHNVTF